MTKAVITGGKQVPTTFPMSTLGIGQFGIVVGGANDGELVVGANREIAYVNKGTWAEKSCSYVYRRLRPDETVTISDDGY